MKQAIRGVRRRLLRERNAAACRAHHDRWEGRTPSFIVVTPHLTHLAPLATQNAGPGVQPVFVANGIGEGDRAWLAAQCPSYLLISVPKLVSQ